MSDKREQLASYAHEAWSGWMKYLFSKSSGLYGDVVIPKDLVERWKRQMHTPYDELSDEEKASDLKEADRMLAIMGGDGSVELNDNGLKKVVEYIDKRNPGFVIRENKLIVNGTNIELVARIPLSEMDNPPDVTVDDPNKPNLNDPQHNKAPVTDKTPIGKAPDSNIMALGRAAAEKAKAEQAGNTANAQNKEQEVDKKVAELTKLSPGNKELGPALKLIAQKLVNSGSAQ